MPRVSGPDAKTLASETQDALASEVLQAIFLIMRRLRREGAQNTGMSFADLMILGYLKREPGRGVSDLAAEAGVSGPTMSTQVKRLEAAGLIVRDPTPEHDRRRISLSLSPRGNALVIDMKQRAAEWMISRLDELDADQRAAITQAAPALAALALAQPGAETCS